MRKAAILVIGTEITTGRTKDQNVQFLGSRLDALGILVNEIRIIPDLEQLIIKTINELRSLYDYVFTTGGIGPTHDDITSMCVAKAFGIPIERHQEIVDLIYKRNPNAHEASYRMADIPKGAILIGNPVTQVPGFRIENVFVFAGVPSIMQGMFHSIADQLEKGKPVLSKTINCHLTEGSLAKGLSEIQVNFNNVEIGSYPYTKEETPEYVNKLNHHPTWGVNVVLRSQNEDALLAASKMVETLIRGLGGNVL